MFGIKMKPEQMLGIAQSMGINVSSIFAELEKAILDEAAKIKGATGKKAFLVAEAINNDQNIKITIYTEGEKEGDLDPYKAFHFAQLLDLFQNAENHTIINETTTPQQAIGTATDNGQPGADDAGDNGGESQPAAEWTA